MDTPDWNPPTIEQAALLPGLSMGQFEVRPYLATDIDPMFDAVASSTRELIPWLPWGRAGYERKDAEDFVRTRPSAWSRNEELSFAIIRSTDRTFVGGAGINRINVATRTANIGYWVRTDATGQGAASTAIRLLARFGFAHLGLQRCEILAAVENFPSQRAALKAGAKHEGIARNRMVLHGVAHDAVLFSLAPVDVA